jgi:hypothetical protein
MKYSGADDFLSSEKERVSSCLRTDLTASGAKLVWALEKGDTLRTISQITGRDRTYTPHKMMGLIGVSRAEDASQLRWV